MVPYQQTDQDYLNELSIQDQFWSENPEDVDVGSTRATNRGRGRGRGRGRRGRISAGSSSHTNTVEENKMIHREVERQRRLEMSNLHASLRSVIPDDYIKGKRSISDHLGEAVNYIKDLEKGVKELGQKRDQLKASVESTNYRYSEGVGGSSQSAPCPGTVVMLPRLGGLDVEINVRYEDDEFALSTALHVILEEGLGIASYTSTKVDDRLVHNIVCEMNDIASIDFDRLHERLIALVC